MGDIKWDGPGYYMKDGDDWLKVCDEHALIWSYEKPVAYYKGVGDYKYGIEYCTETIGDLIETLVQKTKHAAILCNHGAFGWEKAWQDVTILQNSIKVLIKEVLDEH